MIQIIAGEKGKGKTKILLEKVNTEVKTAKGAIVYVDKNNKHMYELSNRVRLINIKDYIINSSDEFIGFLNGIISCDHDIQSIYLDSFLKIAYADNSNLNSLFEKLENISKKFQLDFVISISIDKHNLPENLQELVIVSL